MKKYILPVVVLLTLGAGCTSSVNVVQQPTTTTSVTPTQTPQQLNTEITYYVPNNTDARTQFCNGADMDSAGFKKALTVKKTKIVQGTLTTLEQIKTTLKIAETDPQGVMSSENFTNISSTTLNNGVVTLYPYPGGGWAGVSIFDCAWRPFVEKQLEQFPEVKQIKWEPES